MTLDLTIGDTFNSVPPILKLRKKTGMKFTLSNRLLIVVIAVALLLSALNTYAIFYNTSLLQEQLEAIERDYKEDDAIFNYVIFRDEDVYKAKNQTSGLLDFVSPIASFVISQAVAKGNLVYIKSGVFNLTSDVKISDKVNTRIVSDGATIVGNGHAIVIKGRNYTYSQYNLISGLKIINGSIRIENSFSTTISDIIFENCTTAVELANAETWTEGTKLNKIHFINCVESISFRTPTVNATGSYASTEVTSCFFNQIDNSVGIKVEKDAELSDSQLHNCRMWLAESTNTNQTGLFVDGSMFQTLISSFVFESFAETPEEIYAIVIGENANPAPIIEGGVSFLGNWTARVYNPSDKWISGFGSVFRRSEAIPVGLSNQYGETVNIHARPQTISSFKPRIQVQGSMAEGETVTVRIRLEFVDNVISQSVEKTFSNATTVWLSDDELLKLYPSQNLIWGVMVDAKSSGTVTSASATIDIYGILT